MGLAPCIRGETFWGLVVIALDRYGESSAFGLTEKKII
jgi:hypothetical protein